MQCVLVPPRFTTSGYTSQYSRCSVVCLCLRRRGKAARESVTLSQQGQGYGQTELHRKCDVRLECSLAACGACAELRCKAAHHALGSYDSFTGFFLSCFSIGGTRKLTAWQVCIWWANTASQAHPLPFSPFGLYKQCLHCSCFCMAS